MAWPFVVLVEGPDDMEVFRHVCLRHDLRFTSDRDQAKDARLPAGFVKNKAGYPNLLSSVTEEVKASDLEALAIIIDADIDLKSRWQSVRDTLRRIGYRECPDNPSPDGTIINEPNMPLIGVWIMPDNSSAGILEHFVAKLVPEADVLWPRAQEYVDSIPFDHRPFKAGALPKVKIHTWLAWQEEPGARMGEAIGRYYLDPNSRLATMMVDWIRRIVDQKPSFQTQPNVLG